MIKRLMTRRFCLSFGLALAVTSVLVSHRSGPAPNLEGEGIIYVYFPSLCAQPNDPGDCREITQPSRPAFESAAACWAYANDELNRARNPRQMASCMKEREG